MDEIQGQKPQNRAAVYFDGFNLYHPIHEMGEPFLKWLDLWRLSEMMCKPHALTLQKVVFCTAVPQHLPDKRDRHNSYNNALIAKGVTVVKGHHVFDPTAQKYSEKQSDIHVALSVILDGIDEVYDWAFLVSADSDQAATAKHFSERLPHKKLVSVAPPNKEVPQEGSGLHSDPTHHGTGVDVPKENASPDQGNWRSIIQLICKSVLIRLAACYMISSGAYILPM